MTASSARFWGCWAALGLAECAVGPNYVRPEAPRSGYSTADGPTSTATAENQSQHFNQSNPFAADWWRMFGNPRLDDLVVTAVADNPTLQQAQATLRASQDILRAGYGAFFPQVTGDVGATREKSNLKMFGSSQPSSVFNLFTVSASVSYALDIWGGERRQVEGLRAQQEAQRDNVLGTYLMLAGNVVNTAIARAAYLAQARATEELVALETEQVGIAHAQAEAGTVPFSNVLTLQSELATTRATLPALQQKVDQASHLLAALLGRGPAEVPSLSYPNGLELIDFKLPEDLPLSLPSQLVRQRPDILMAEAQLVNANAQIGVATAALFPNLTLSGTIGANNTALSDIFQPAALFWSFGASLVGPLIDGGTRWYQRKAAIEAHDAVLASYRQTVLGALQQVADALQALAHDADALRAQADAAHAASDALQLTRVNYQSGIATYLQVLIADQQYHQAMLSYLQAQAQRLQDTVALYVALGGGWWVSPKPLAFSDRGSRRPFELPSPPEHMRRNT